MDQPAVDPSLDLEAEIAGSSTSATRSSSRTTTRSREIQDLADFIGDSLQLAQAAREDRGRRHRVLRRPLHGRDGEDPEPATDRRAPRPGRRLLARRRLPGRSLRDVAARATRTPSVSYINCSAAVKALSDIICTSSNAEKIVALGAGRTRRSSSRPTRTSARWLAAEDRPRHGALAGQLHRARDVQRAEAVELKTRHPSAQVIAHPECEEPVLDMPTSSARRRAPRASRPRPTTASSSSPPSRASCTRCRRRRPTRRSSRRRPRRTARATSART